ncbi:hypothetical protein [Wenxinia marina]|uniref:Wenxma_15, whole genome shotgun sequence n=1 Tax=Wenxinia marina DSM 24838 TaxID=1123501 RepID=A0A0D0Q101_9RHOB|nr:hypothetical protein [Wenxinia marina]KIQ68194.1 EF hand [Wenxinia marina DSM 24838]GGL76665.1 hypothetical protein GCM10011392_33880 [Wenxinia marina]
MLRLDKNTTLALGTALALVAGPTLAQTASDWDLDGDGTLTRDEFTQSVGDAGVFANWDANDDGMIDQDELAGGAYDRYDADMNAELAGSEFESAQTDFGPEGRWSAGADWTSDYAGWDVDADGLLTRDEFRTGFADTPVLNDWDIDSDGMLNEEEFSGGVYGGYDPTGAGYIQEPGLAGVETDMGDEGFWSS